MSEFLVIWQIYTDCAVRRISATVFKAPISPPILINNNISSADIYKYIKKWVHLSDTKIYD